MAALPLPAAILDDLISEMRSSKMATGSGRAAIFHLHLNGGPNKPPQVLDDVISGAAILDSRWRRHK